MPNRDQHSQNTLANLRRNYDFPELTRRTLATNPLEQFDHWFQQALASDHLDASAFVLSTIDYQSGVPNARVLLLKQYDDTGLVWYTNYLSDKGRDMEANPNVSLCFFWEQLGRQIRIHGQVEKIDPDTSATYFLSRPLDSQLAAMASQQSRPIDNRQVLNQALQDLQQQYPQGIDSAPDHWGGYRCVPTQFEFWQGRPSRLHDRFLYTKQPDQTWSIQRLSP